MNVLVLVFTMLSLLTVMTYSQLKTFLDAAGMRIEYERFMMKEERKSNNDLEDIKYTNSYVDKNAAKDTGKDRGEAALAKLHVKVLFDKKEEDEQAGVGKEPAKDAEKENKDGPTDRFESTKDILKKLIDILYGKQAFYKEALKKRPDLIDDLIREMMKTASKSTCKLKFTNIRDLANIPFTDNPDLREVFYKMLKGEPSSTRLNDRGKEVVAKEGYPSIQEYLTVARTPSKIRVWLARKALLQAIFRDPQAIIDRRDELHKYIKDEVWTVDGAQEEFNRFNDALNTEVDLKMLDFKVSKTRPPSD
ncbi:MAG: hypothetical protein Q8K75_09125 [Chlamydiales bacterium]|nr:hypothetical protein [Chlamydiales bacterium]